MSIPRRTHFVLTATLARGALAAAALSLAAASLGVAQAAGAGDAKHSDPVQARQWIAQMKDSARGPFARIRWFCKDGRVLEPKDYGCAEKGEGWQHGEWSVRTKELRVSMGNRLRTWKLV